MPTYKNTTELQNQIRHLEVTKEVQTKHLKEGFDEFIENFKPSHILHNTYNNVKSSPHKMEIVTGVVIAITMGYFAKKLILRGSASIVRKIIGFATQSVITFLISKYAFNAKNLFFHILQQVKGRHGFVGVN